MGGLLKEAFGRMEENNRVSLKKKKKERKLKRKKGKKERKGRKKATEKKFKRGMIHFR